MLLTHRDKRIINKDAKLGNFLLITTYRLVFIHLVLPIFRTMIYEAKAALKSTGKECQAYLSVGFSSDELRKASPI
ncbi:hypothetical protein YK48G_07700 [Lentilactobacillus fungorum]|uniref:Uncharacterized protein n=1 Tax=Lentilactobacillus fungorum TaxID=2201250 RepID=A0ABQ3VWS1_9LACO|nr:hypothetical protein YK48G_07700 [Lentilactobacillus fungorum]